MIKSCGGSYWQDETSEAVTIYFCLYVLFVTRGQLAYIESIDIYLCSSLLHPSRDRCSTASSYPRLPKIRGVELVYPFGLATRPSLCARETCSVTYPQKKLSTFQLAPIKTPDIP